MKISEFIDTYSDDIIYLQKGRKVLLTHPLRRENKEFCNASFCRMFAVMMIGSIEAMLQEWKDSDKIGILELYFTEKSSNADRIESLCNAFINAGIPVEREVFDDYLAIKYLRNTIVHSGWKDKEKEWLNQRNFPTDTRKLTENHWRKMDYVNQNMMLYIFTTSVKGDISAPSSQTIKVPETTNENDLGIVELRDIPNIFWLNLEKIDSHIYPAIEKSAITEKYYWAKELSKDQIEQMPHQERKRRFYLAARLAGEDGFPQLVRLQSFAEKALSSWQEYWRLTFDYNGISLEDLKKSLEVLGELHKKRSYPKSGSFILINQEISLEIMTKLIQELIEDYEPFTEQDIAFALSKGKDVYETMHNITPVQLLALHLPIIDPKNTSSYIQEAEKAIAASELNDYWYSYIEQANAPDYDKWSFCRQMCSLFSS